VDVRGRESFFAFCRELPLQCTACRVERVEIRVVAREVHDTGLPPPATTRRDPCVANFHRSAPVAASIAYRLLSVLPTNTTPPATAGDE
jgi:hypothetical protein